MTFFFSLFVFFAAFPLFFFCFFLFIWSSTSLCLVRVYYSCALPQFFFSFFRKFENHPHQENPAFLSSPSNNNKLIIKKKKKKKVVFSFQKKKKRFQFFNGVVGEVSQVVQWDGKVIDKGGIC